MFFLLKLFSEYNDLLHTFSWNLFHIVPIKFTVSSTFGSTVILRIHSWYECSLFAVFSIVFGGSDHPLLFPLYDFFPVEAITKFVLFFIRQSFSLDLLLYFSGCTFILFFETNVYFLFLNIVNVKDYRGKLKKIKYS